MEYFTLNELKLMQFVLPCDKFRAIFTIPDVYINEKVK